MVPGRGEVWIVNLVPVAGQEQVKRRPALVLSADAFNAAGAELAVVVPLSTRNRHVPLHVPLIAPEGGVTRTTFILCDQVRTISMQRLATRIGVLRPATLQVVEEKVRLLLGL